MSILTSLLEVLLKDLPQLRSQMYFKSSLTALSRAMEDQVLAATDQPLVIASFQQERFYLQEANRYRRIANRSDQVYVLVAPETAVARGVDPHETIAFDTTDPLNQEWHLVVLGQLYASCLICRERHASDLPGFARPAFQEIAIDPARRFEGIWSADRYVTAYAAELLLKRIGTYRSGLADKIDQARERYGITVLLEAVAESGIRRVDSDPFTQRLVTHLHASQYKLLKAYRSLAAKAQKERVVNSIATAIRQSLDSDEILAIAAQELGQVLQVGRCLIYRCKPTDAIATLQHEYLDPGMESLSGQPWPLQNNPLFQTVLQTQERAAVRDVQTDEQLAATVHLPISGQEQGADASLQSLLRRWHITSWLMVPVLYQGQLLGMVELHHCGACSREWSSNELDVVDAIATQIGVTLIQAEAYTNLTALNQQLEDLDRTRSNLIAITGTNCARPSPQSRSAWKAWPANPTCRQNCGK